MATESTSDVPDEPADDHTDMLWLPSMDMDIRTTVAPDGTTTFEFTHTWGCRSISMMREHAEAQQAAADAARSMLFGTAEGDDDTDPAVLPPSRAYL